MEPAILAFILLAVWRAPLWGQRILVLLRDVQDYRLDRHRATVREPPIEPPGGSATHGWRGFDKFA